MKGFFLSSKLLSPSFSFPLFTDFLSLVISSSYDLYPEGPVLSCVPDRGSD